MASSSANQNWIGIALKVLVAVLAVALIKEQSRDLQALDFSAGDTNANLLAIGLFWIAVLAPGFYLCALWSLASFFGRAKEPKSFGQEVVKSLRDVGQCLIIGAACAVVLEPSLTVWMIDRFRGFRYSARIEDITIGLIGAALYLLAASGQRLRDELEQFV